MTMLLNFTLSLLGSLTFAGQAGPAHFDLVGAAWHAQNSTVYRIDPFTGQASAVGTAGLSRLNSLAQDGAGRLYSASERRLVTLNPWTGAATEVATLNFGGAFVDVRGMAFSPAGVLYAINNGGTPGSATGWDDLYRIDVNTGLGTLVGNTGMPGIQSLEFSPHGVLYGWEVGSRLGLVTVNPLTGTATDVNPSISGTSDSGQGLVFGPDGVLYSAGNGLWRVDPTTGIETPVGAGGSWDVRGLAVLVPEPSSGLLTLMGGSVAALAMRRRRRALQARSAQEPVDLHHQLP